MSELERLGARWREALAQWGIPQEILDDAPVSPWGHAPGLHRMADDDAEAPETASFTEARAALGAGGTVLDVGCGGGRSSLPLGVDRVDHVTGVDEHQAMLDQFLDAAARLAIPATAHPGRWPDVAALVAPADLVVCHHVVYNVGDIVPFLQALTAHARRRVVVECTVRHPQSGFNPLWEHFWGLSRPTEPTSDLLVAIVRALDYDPVVSVAQRPPRRATLDRTELVAFARQRLCLTADRDPEIDAVLGDEVAFGVDGFASVAWSPPAPSA